ncbi:MAG: helix-turn-helix domain-containing protein [Lacisediminihabitans sp.]
MDPTSALISRPPAASGGLEPLLSIADLAEYLGVPIATIYDWRTQHKGPAGHRFGKHVMFAVSDVKNWVEKQRDPAFSSDGR